jgi:copper chaperone CopZ
MSTGKLMGAGILSAIAASLCCITPVLALVAGTGSMASSLSWIEPARPYMIGLTVVVLGFAWYLQLRPKPKDNCGCEPARRSFFQSRKFLLLITVLSGLMIAFPAYSHIFFRVEPKEQATRINDGQKLEVNIEGMTCAACEQHVAHEVNQLPGILHLTVSYDKKNAIIEFDPSQTTADAVIAAVNKTGYKVVDTHLKK